MTTCLHAHWDPLGPQTQARLTRHDVVIVHTMAGTFAGTDTFFHQNGYGGTESHFGIKGDGFAKQWQDLDFRADANLDANDRAISIETADRGESFPAWSGSDVPPWTEAQLDKLVLIIRWCCDHYQIPAQLVPNSVDGHRGIAYHRQGIDGNFGPPFPGRQGVGERWSTSTGKPCPGDRRIRQLIDIVIPRVRGEEDDMTEKELATAYGRDPLRPVVKSLMQGALLDGLRERTDAHPDRGVLREPFKELLREVLDERDGT